MTLVTLFVYINRSQSCHIPLTAIWTCLYCMSLIWIKDIPNFSFRHSFRIDSVSLNRHRRSNWNKNYASQSFCTCMQRIWRAWNTSKFFSICTQGNRCFTLFRFRYIQLNFFGIWIKVEKQKNLEGVNRGSSEPSHRSRASNPLYFIYLVSRPIWYVGIYILFCKMWMKNIMKACDNRAFGMLHNK